MKRYRLLCLKNHLSLCLNCNSAMNPVDRWCNLTASIFVIPIIVMRIAIRCTHYIFGKRSKAWTNPELFDLLSFHFFPYIIMKYFNSTTFKADSQFCTA